MSQPDTPAEPAGGRRFLFAWLAVAAVVVLAHFGLANRMGFYEDDYWHVGVPMCEWHRPVELKSMVYGVFHRYEQGRPVGFALGYALAFASTHVGGVVGAYALSAAILSMNAGLLMLLLRPRFGTFAATAAALGFVLFPADTTRPMVHAALFVHPAVTLLLLSGLAYARGRPLLSAAAAGLTLVVYEACFPPAVVWPLLFPDTGRPLWRRCVTYGLSLVAVAVALAVPRMYFGDARLRDVTADRAATARKMVRLATDGPVTAAETLVSRPPVAAWVWVERRAESAPPADSAPYRRAALCLASAAALAILAGLVLASPGGGVPSVWALVRLAAGGAAMAVLGYVGSLTREPDVVLGRMSSVHLVPAVGWGVLFGALVALVVRAAGRVRLGVPATVAVAAYLATLAAFHVQIQREYVRVWQTQARMWGDIATECPDVRSGTVILCPLVTQSSGVVHNQEWVDPLILPHLFRVPAGWDPPRVFPVGAPQWWVPDSYYGYDWHEVRRDGDTLYWNHWVPHWSPRLEPGNVILLRQRPDGRLERMTGSVRMQGIDLPLKPREPATPLRPNKLFPVMFPKGLPR